PIEHLVVSADLAGGDVGGDAPPHHGAVPDRDAVINPRPLPDHHIIASLHACTDPGAVDDAAAVADTAALTHCRVRADRRALADGRAAAYGPEELDDTAIPDPRPGADDGPGGQARPVADSGVHRHQGVPTDASVAANPCAAFDERARLDPRPGADLGTAVHVRRPARQGRRPHGDAPVRERGELLGGVVVLRRERVRLAGRAADVHVGLPSMHGAELAAIALLARVLLPLDRHRA